MGGINPKWIVIALCLFVTNASITANEKSEQTDTKSLTKEIRDLLVAFTSTLDTKKNNENLESELTPDEVRKFLAVMDDPKKKQKLMEQVKDVNKENVKKFDVAQAPLYFFDLAKEWFTVDFALYSVKVLIRILIIISFYFLLRRLIDRMVLVFINKMSAGRNNAKTTNAVAKTISPIIRSILHWFLTALMIFLLLIEFNINVMPIIYSFSLLGLAVSIGSQTLVKDIINGFMTLFEGNISVGDVITVGNQKGTVEFISLRCIHLRHSSGGLETIPFSEMSHITNHSRDYSVAEIQLIVAHTADFEKVEKCLQSIFLKMKNDDFFKSFIRGDLKLCGVKKIDLCGVEFGAEIPTIPDPAKKFANEFNRELAKELRKNNIPMPCVGTFNLTNN